MCERGGQHHAAHYFMRHIVNINKGYIDSAFVMRNSNHRSGSHFLAKKKSRLD